MATLSDPIRIARFSICSCTEYKETIVQKEYEFKLSFEADSFSVIRSESPPSNKHVVISIDTVSLYETNAVALSYTWGEFDRRKVPIGHFQGKASENPKCLELGEDWDVPEMLDRLAKISSKSGGMWIDQLCMPQKDEDQIRQTLNRIPDIFSTLDVVALMPGSTCTCLRRCLGLSEPREMKGAGLTAVIDNNVEAMVARNPYERYVISSCLNSWGMSSWHCRIWTYQEARYARKLKIVWNLKTPLECVYSQSPSESGLNSLNRYAKLWLARKNPKGRGVVASMVSLYEEAMKLRLSMDLFSKSIFEKYRPLPEGYRPVLSLMFGDPVSGSPKGGTLGSEPNSGPTRQPDIVKDLWALCEAMVFLSAAERAATKPRDYVLAVWVKLPYYEQPISAKSMKASELLEDAILQLEKRNATFPCLAASGLFAPPTSASAAGLWRPTRYVGHDDASIASSFDLYGSIQLGEPIFTFDGKVPFKFSNSGTSLAQRTFRYESFSADQTAKEIFDQNVLILKNAEGRGNAALALWSSDFFLPKRNTFIIYSLVRKSAFYELGYALLGFSDEERRQIKQVLYIHALTSKSASQESFYAQLAEDPELDHEAAMYKITCYMLGLRVDVCRQNDLELVIAAAFEPYIIGLRKKGLAGEVDKIKTITLLSEKTARVDSTLAMALLEVKEVEDSAGEPQQGYKPNYEIVGAWAPAKRMTDEDLGGSAIPWKEGVTQDEVDADARLVN